MKLVSMLLMLLVGAQAFAAAPVNPNIKPNQPLPTTVLTCGGAIITQITNRLQDQNGTPDPDSGSAVVFNNGGYNVSYDTIPAIQKSKVGQHVMICLVYVPEGCPPGDDRSRVYTVTNLTTLESWTLPDAEHMCGGA
jgi:hypothetical protein